MRQVKLAAKNQLSAQKSVWTLFWKVRAKMRVQIGPLSIRERARVRAVLALASCQRVMFRLPPYLLRPLFRSRCLDRLRQPTKLRDRKEVYGRKRRRTAVLIFQDPMDPRSRYLLESLLDACGSARKVAGAFAFASSAGVRLVTQDTSFREVAENHEIDLIVGVDAVTNNEALDSLLEASSGNQDFRVRAFLNPRNDVIFHPKVCWTKKNDTGVVITGSGNLTEAGLLGNWEAYSLETLNRQQLIEVESTWEDWLERHDEWLRPLDDKEVRNRASQNTVMAQQGDLPTLQTRPETSEDERKSETDSQTHPLDGSPVLVAEIPKSKDRWKQANFLKNDYENFFGARVGERRLVMFRHVEQNGKLSPYTHNRRSVEVKSHNYRFELDAATGLPYPQDGRPIGVFIRIATRTFLYHLLMPSDQEYPNVVRILDESDDNSSVRRFRMTALQLRQSWPTAPFWNLSDT